MADKKIVEIHYQKNPLYRSIYSDGAIGGLTPLNFINLNFYATRQPIPRSTQQSIYEDGLIDAEVSDDSKKGIIREIEFGVYMSRQTAEDLYSFLKGIFEPSTKKI